MHDGRYKYQITKQKIIDFAKTLPENAPLPNRNDLAKICGVSRVTLERAVSELIGEGLLVSEDGRGTYAARREGGPGGKPASASNVWALLVYSVTRGVAPALVRGVEDFTNERGTSLILCNTDNDPHKETEYLKKLCDQDIKGIILVPSTHSMPDKAVFDALESRGVAIVACSRQVPGHDFPGTFQNFFLAGFMATQHLLQRGCRRIAYLATSRYSTIEDRLQGYLAALSQHNLQYPDDPAGDAFGLSNVTGGFMADFEERLTDFLRQHPDTDGMYVFLDHLAITLYEVMNKLGLAPGKDIRVIASDDGGFSRAFSTPLSTVDYPAYKMGASAAQQLYSLIHGRDTGVLPKHIILSCDLNARQSTLM